VRERQKPDWLDFLALTIAAYQLIIPAVLFMLLLAVGAVFLLKLLAG